MADQVIPAGGLAPAIPLAQPVAAKTKPAPEKARPSRVGETPSRRDEASSAAAEATPAPDPIRASAAALEQINSHLQQTATQLKIQVDSETGHTYFRIMNADTGEVLMQVPSEELLAMARNLRALDLQNGASGVLLDKEG